MEFNFIITEREINGEDMIAAVKWKLYGKSGHRYMALDGRYDFPAEYMLPSSATDDDIRATLNGNVGPWMIRDGFNTEFARREAAGTLDIPTLTFRQLIIGLLMGGFINEAEAIAAAETRARPQQLETIIAAMSFQDGMMARITWATMTNALRTDPLFAALVAANIATDEQIDALFEMAKAI